LSGNRKRTAGEGILARGVNAIKVSYTAEWMS
jgi:hypothetical protein